MSPNGISGPSPFVSKKGERMKVQSIEDILIPLQEKKQFLHDSFGVLKIGIFGSFTKGNQTVSSDIDIIVELDKGKKTLHNFLALKRLLENEFERSVDLGFEHTLKSAVRNKIKKEITYV